MTYEEAKDLVKAGKFIVIKDHIIDCDFGICASLSGKTDYGIFEIEDYHIEGTSFKAVLNPKMSGFMKRAWYTSDIISMMMDKPEIQIFDMYEDAECYHYVLTNKNF